MFPKKQISYQFLKYIKPTWYFNLRPDKINYKQCPKCKDEAKTNKEVLDLFGRMTVNGKPYIQSWCKNCRKDKEKPIFHKDSQQNLIEEND